MASSITRRLAQVFLTSGYKSIRPMPNAFLRQHPFILKPRFLGVSTTTPTSTDKEEKGKEKETVEKKSDEDSDSDSEIEQELRNALSKANSEASNYLAKSRDFEDKYKRSLAEAENMRTRLTKQIQDQKLYAIQSFCKDLTDIEDILRLAIESVPKEQVEENKYLKELYQGLTMTEARLIQVFKSNGLTQINPINTKFNPNEHEAVVQKEEEGKESGTVIFVSKMGYKLHERVIRPAVVGVAK